MSTVDPGATCLRHADQPAAGSCARCGRFVCSACAGRFNVCPECAARELVRWPDPKPWATATRWGIYLDNAVGFVLLGVTQAATHASSNFQRGLILLATAGITLAGLALTLAVPVAFLRWQHLTMRRAAALGVEPGVTPGWAVGWWLIPLVNFHAGFHRLRAFGLRLTGAGALPIPLIIVWQLSFAGSFVVAWAIPLALREVPFWATATSAALWLVASVCCLRVMKTIQTALADAELARAAVPPAAVT